MPGGTCDVCGGSPVLGVASSCLGPCSFAYCGRCMAAGAEPYFMVVSTLAICGRNPSGVWNVARWFWDVADATLAVVGRTRTELMADAEKEEAEVRRAEGEVRG